MKLTVSKLREFRNKVGTSVHSSIAVSSYKEYFIRFLELIIEIKLLSQFYSLRSMWLAIETMQWDMLHSLQKDAGMGVFSIIISIIINNINYSENENNTIRLKNPSLHIYSILNFVHLTGEQRGGFFVSRYQFAEESLAHGSSTAWRPDQVHYLLRVRSFHYLIRN